MNFKKILGLSVLAAVGFSACQKKLDQFPPNAIATDQAFLAVKDAKAWDQGMYALLRARSYGIFTYTQDVQGNQLNATKDFGNRNGGPHRWDWQSDDYSIRDTWAGYYNTIANVNRAIEGFQGITPATPAETDSLNRYKADAYAARAYSYLQLVLRWAKPYEPATAASDLAVPMPLVYDVNAKPARATVKQVYDQILADIATAKPLLANYGVVAGATHFNKQSLNALEARARLYMQDWTGAKAAADLVISSGTYPLYTTQANITNYWAVDLTGETIMQSYVSKPNELPNTNAIYLGFNTGLNKYVPDFVPAQWVVDFYDNADFRKAAYFAQKPVYIQTVDYPNTWLVNKYPGNPAFFTTATTNYVNVPKLFRVAEMYLISAEAGARAGGAAEADAAIKLNALRVARGLPSLGAIVGAPLLQAVKDERFRELAFEGFYLFDLKRWHQGFSRHDPQNAGMLSNSPAAAYLDLTVTADADKYTWGFPANDYLINTSLRPQNPGW